MEKYEQLEFELTKKLGRFKERKPRCLDNNGDEIKVGDYVIAVHGSSRDNYVEGIVSDIEFCEGEGAYLTIVNRFGQVIERDGRPFNFDVLK